VFVCCNSPHDPMVVCWTVCWTCIPLLDLMARFCCAGYGHASQAMGKRSLCRVCYVQHLVIVTHVKLLTTSLLVIERHTLWLFRA